MHKNEEGFRADLATGRTLDISHGGIRLELTEAGREATARTEKALAIRFAQLLRDRTDVVDNVRDLVAGMGKALDRERQVA